MAIRAASARLTGGPSGPVVATTSEGVPCSTPSCPPTALNVVILPAGRRYLAACSAGVELRLQRLLRLGQGFADGDAALEQVQRHRGDVGAHRPCPGGRDQPAPAGHLLRGELAERVVPDVLLRGGDRLPDGDAVVVIGELHILVQPQQVLDERPGRRLLLRASGHDKRVHPPEGDLPAPWRERVGGEAVLEAGPDGRAEGVARSRRVGLVVAGEGAVDEELWRRRRLAQLLERRPTPLQIDDLGQPLQGLEALVVIDGHLGAVGAEQLSPQLPEGHRPGQLGAAPDEGVKAGGFHGPAIALGRPGDRLLQLGPRPGRPRCVRVRPGRIGHR